LDLNAPHVSEANNANEVSIPLKPTSTKTVNSFKSSVSKNPLHLPAISSSKAPSLIADFVLLMPVSEIKVKRRTSAIPNSADC
jgi:hypothetical protein